MVLIARSICGEVTVHRIKMNREWVYYAFVCLLCICVCSCVLCVLMCVVDVCVCVVDVYVCVCVGDVARLKRRRKRTTKTTVFVTKLKQEKRAHLSVVFLNQPHGEDAAEWSTDKRGTGWNWLVIGHNKNPNQAEPIKLTDRFPYGGLLLSPRLFF